jgi:predicted nucleic acid-binding protein
MDVTSSLAIDRASSTNEFQSLTSTAVATQESFGKVSGSTGWSSVLSVFGHAASSDIHGLQLKNAIQNAYGSTVAETIDQQLSLSKAGEKPISVFKVAKAVAMVGELTFLHDVEMKVGDNARSLDPNDQFYLHEKAQFKADSKITDKNELLRKQDWSVITTTMALDPQKTSKTTTTTITPAGKSDALKGKYTAKKIGGIPSSDTSSEHAVGLRINKSDQFSIVSSGLDVPLKVEASQVDDIIKTRFEERLLVNLETQGKLPTATPAEGQPGFSADNSITISMTDFGLLTADVSKEGKAQDKQFVFLKQYDGTKSIAVTYKNSNGDDVTVHVKPTVRAFNFGAQWMDRSIIGRTLTYLKACFGFKKGYERAVDWKNKNEAAFDSLIGPATSTAVNETTPLTSSDQSDDTGKALAAINKFTADPLPNDITPAEEDLIKTIYKNNTDGELNLTNITADQKDKLVKLKANIDKLLPEVKQARERLKTPSHADYHDEALVLCLSSMIGASPNIHCKSGKDRTSLLLSYSQWIMHEIKNHGDIPKPGAYTPAQRARLDKFLVGTGNSYWQFLNTMNVGNKQAAGWWSFRSNFYKTLTTPQQRILAGNEADSSA